MSREVNQGEAVIQSEKIDVLSAPRRLADPSESWDPGQRIDQRALACVRAAREGNLTRIPSWAIRQTARGFDESSLPLHCASRADGRTTVRLDPYRLHRPRCWR